MYIYIYSVYIYTQRVYVYIYISLQPLLVGYIPIYIVIFIQYI